MAKGVTVSGGFNYEWLMNGESVKAEFGKAILYDKERKIESDSNAKFNMHNPDSHLLEGGVFQIKAKNTVLTNKRLVFLDKKGDISLEIAIGLESTRERIRNVKAVNDQARNQSRFRKSKYGYVKTIFWLYDVKSDLSYGYRDEVELYVVRFPANFLDSNFDPKYSDKVKIRGYKLFKNFMIGTRKYNIKLSKHSNPEELISRIREGLPDPDPDLRLYSSDINRPIGDYLGMTPENVVQKYGKWRDKAAYYGVEKEIEKEW